MAKNEHKKENTSNPHGHPAKTDKNKKVKRQRFVLTKFEICANIGGYSVGDIARLKCHKGTKIPVDRYWRRRLRDATVDGCIKLYKEPKNENINND